MPIGSTRYIAYNLEDAEESRLSSRPARKKLFSFELPAAEQEKLCVLNQTQELGLEFPQGEGLDLMEALSKELKRLKEIEEKSKKNQDKLLIKKYKLAILKAFELHLYQLAELTPLEEKKKENSLLKRLLRQLGYGFLLTVGLVMDGIGSFLGGQELMYLLPGVSSPIAIAVGIVFSLINSALFYSFEAGMLKQAMGMDSMDEIGSHLEVDEEEIQATNKINALMINQATRKLTPHTYSIYAGLTATINQSILDKKQFHQAELAEKASHKILRHVVTAVGALMVAGYSYFMANSLLVFAAPALIGTPIGWAFICVGVATMLAYYLSMRGKAMVNTLNPSMQKFKDVKVQFDRFEPKSEADLKLAYEEKKNKADSQQLREEVKALKKENMELKGKLIEKTLIKRTPPQIPQTVIQESHSFWSSASQRTSEKQDISPSHIQSLAISS